LNQPILSTRGFTVEDTDILNYMIKSTGPLPKQDLTVVTESRTKILMNYDRITSNKQSFEAKNTKNNSPVELVGLRLPRFDQSPEVMMVPLHPTELKY
jgi:hypothetical protein